MQLSARFEHSLLAIETEHDVHCMLEIASPTAPKSATRTPLDLALVIDRSGSMAGPKLDVTKECAAFLARRLSPTDRIALVTYDHEVQLVSPLANPSTVLFTAIDSIASGGQTNLSGGWMKGLEVLGGADERGAIRKVLLLTDGLANVGVTDAPSLVSLAQGAGTSQRVGTTTIGFGDDFDEELLTSMAEAGDGNAHFAASPDDAPGIFAKEFDDLVSLIAQEVSEEVVILKSARAQRDARTRARHGDFDGAKSVLKEAADELRSHSAGSAHADELQRLATDLEADVPFMEMGMFDATSSKRLHYKQNLSRERRIRPPTP